MPGKLAHFEMPAKDAGRATQFYSSLFGWQFADPGMPGVEYHMTEAGGGPGGAVYPGEDGGSGAIIYFDSDDIDATVAQVRELGGEAEDKQPIPHVGWFARCKDTEGNAFSLFQSDESVTG